MFQYTVKNHRLPHCPVVLRTQQRAQVLGWLYMRTTSRCLDRARYGLAKLDRRAASVVQYGLFGRDNYLGARA